MASRSETRKKTKQIQVRATPEEKEQLKARADAFGLSVGELCRQAVFGVKLKAQVDRDAIDALHDARADLGRMGGLLKGWLAGSFPGAPRPDIEEVRDLLKQINASQEKVITSVKELMEKKA